MATHHCFCVNLLIILWLFSYLLHITPVLVIWILFLPTFFRSSFPPLFCGFSISLLSLLLPLQHSTTHSSFIYIYIFNARLFFSFFHIFRGFGPIVPFYLFCLILLLLWVCPSISPLYEYSMLLLQAFYLGGYLPNLGLQTWVLIFISIPYWQNPLTTKISD